MKKYDIIKKTGLWGMLALALVGLGACSDEIDTPDNFDGGDITLTLNVPDFTTEAVGTRAVDENGISDVTILGYDASNVCKVMTTYSGSDLTSSGSKVTLRISLPKGVNRIEVATNAKSLLTTVPTAPLSDLYNTASLAAASNLVFWGKSTLHELFDTGVVNLTRQTAKVSAKNAASGFEFTGLKVCGTASRGAVAPKFNNAGVEALNPYSADAYTTTSAYVVAGAPVYVYETPADKPYMIVKGKYQSKEYYYKVGFYRQGTNIRMDLVRNHHYELTVKDVLGTGCSTESEAISGDYSNRLVVELLDHDQRIFNLVGNNDYALGVCDNITLGCTATSADIAVVTIAASADLFSAPTATVSSDAQSWITGVNVGTATDVAPGTYTSLAKSYTLKVALKANSGSTQPRTGEITVRFRDLVQKVTVTQEGTDFKRDVNRKVVYKTGGTTITSDYFTWLDNTVKGVRPENMQGVARNEGLHFSTETDAAQQAYSIPALSGDVLKSVNNSRIKVAKNGSNWDVTITNGGTAETSMWTSSFVITNGSGIDIVYPVYRTGIFHQITSSVANTYQVTEEKQTGWFYYETVAITAGGKTYYVLDRNLGAENNGPYSMTTAALNANAGSVGAYYKISNSAPVLTTMSNGAQVNKGDNIKTQICPAGFTIPSKAQMSGMNFLPGTFVTSTGESYRCASQATNSTLSKLARIYIPTGGFVEGDNLKNLNHANVWTCTYVAGTQGFSPTSPEFCYWFIYYDCAGEMVGMSNMRFVNGGGGTMGQVFRGMPVRCIRGDRTAENDGAANGSGTPAVEKITIYFSNADVNWDPPYCYSYDSNGDNDGGWPGKKMTWEKGAVYRAVVPRGSKIIFSNNGGNQYPTSGIDAVAGHIYSNYKNLGDLGVYNSSGTQIFWENSSAGWGQPKAYSWDDSGNNNGGTGVNMTKVSGNLWTVTLPSNYKYVVINNGSWGDGNQTVDMNLSAGIVYSKDNQYTHKK